MNPLRIIVISGLPGTGKSTLAEALAEKLQIPVFSVDPIESSILKTGLKRNFKTGLAAYLVVETLAAEQLKLGLSVIIDAVSPVKEARDMWQGLQKKFRARLFIIECVLDQDLHRDRIRARIRNLHGIPEVTWAAVQKRRKEFLPWTQNRLVIDTSHPTPQNLSSVLRYISINQ